MHGKFLRFYKDKKSARTRRDILHNKESPIDLSDAKCDKAFEYTKRRFVLKLTLYGMQLHTFETDLKIQQFFRDVNFSNVRKQWAIRFKLPAVSGL